MAAAVKTRSRWRWAQRRLALKQPRPAGQYRLVRKEPRQISTQLFGGRVAARWVLGNRLQDDGLQVARNGGVLPARRDGLVERNLPQQLLMVAAAKRRMQCQQFVEGHPQGIDVRTLVDDPAAGLGLLWAHVAQRADHIAGVGQAEITRAPGQAEVGDPQAPRESIRRLAGLMSRWTIPRAWA